jgi:hypothetical protein
MSGGALRHRAGVILQRGGTRRCGGVDAVVLGPSAAGEFPDPGGGGGGGGGRDVEDDLPDGQQPLRQVVAEPVGVLDCPLASGPGLGPDDQLLVSGEGGVDAAEPRSVLVAGSTAVAVWLDL